MRSHSRPPREYASVGSAGLGRGSGRGVEEQRGMGEPTANKEMQRQKRGYEGKAKTKERLARHKVQRHRHKENTKGGNVPPTGALDGTQSRAAHGGASAAARRSNLNMPGPECRSRRPLTSSASVPETPRNGGICCAAVSDTCSG